MWQHGQTPGKFGHGNGPRRTSAFRGVHEEGVHEAIDRCRMAVVLLVSVAPVLAGDSFYALSRLAGLSPLDDAQLATVQGGQVNQSMQNQSMQVVNQSMIDGNSMTIGNIDQNTTVAVSLEEVAAVQAFGEGWLQAIFQGQVAAVQAFGEGWLQAIFQGQVAAVQAFGEGWLQR